MNNKKLSYFLHALANSLSPKVCPTCGHIGGSIIDRKYWVTTLIECSNCHLQYRHPIDKSDFNEDFYNNDYAETDGITTDLPNDSQLREMVATNFKNTAKDISHHIAVIEAAGSKLENLRVVDFGANWGYGSYQLTKKGCVVQSYELAKQRAHFGERLGIKIKTETSEIEGGVDVFYNSHVIEHLPSITAMIDLARKVLSPNGYFITFCPNGSDSFRRRQPTNFHLGWGMVHPNYLNEKFYIKLFKDNPYYIGSTPFDISTIKKIDGNQLIGNLEGDELLVVCQLNKKR